MPVLMTCAVACGLGCADAGAQRGAMPLDDALRRLAAATGWQIVFDPALVAGRRARGGRNGGDPARALRRLLAGSGLKAIRLAGNVVIIAPDPRRRPAVVAPRAAEDEIVVTALKRATPLDDTELSIATLSAAQIEARGITDLRGAARLLPGLAAFNTSALQQRLTVRGVSATGEATVGVYFGETPIAGPSGTGADPGASAPDIDLVDVERVELLKGPQGTLYGAGSMGGTLRILPRIADLARPAARVEVRGEAMAQGEAGGAIVAVANLPLVTDRLATRVVAWRRSQGGYIDNDRLGLTNTSGLRREGARVQLGWAPDDVWRLDLMYLHQNTRLDDGGFWVPDVGRYRTVQAAVTPNSDRLDLFTETLRGTFDKAIVTATASHLHRRIVRQIDYTGVLARQRDSAAGCRRLTGAAACDAAQQQLYRAYVDARLPAILYQPTRMNSSSGEIRIAAPAYAVTAWTLGAFVERREDMVASYAARADPATGRLIRPLDIIGLRTIATAIDQQALFAEATHPVAPRLSATAGIRLYRYRLRGSGTVPVVNIITGSAMAAGARDAGSATGSNLKGELAYRVPDGPLVYALVSEGFRPGGINVTPGLGPAEQVYGADRLWNYELGVKAGQGPFAIEAACYHIDWREATFAVTSANGAFLYNTNLSNVSIRGAEVRGTLATGPWRLAAAGSFTDARLDEDTTLSTSEGVGRRGDRLPNVPQWAYLLSAELRAGAVTTGIDVSGNGASPTGFDATTPFYARTGVRTEVAARANWRHGRWHVDVNIDNLFDAATPVRLFSSAFGDRQLFGGRPRTLSLRGSIDL